MLSLADDAGFYRASNEQDSHIRHDTVVVDPAQTDFTAEAFLIIAMMWASRQCGRREMTPWRFLLNGGTVCAEQAVA